MNFNAPEMEMDSSFLKLKDGESVTGIFQGEPFCFQQHWTGSRGEICTGEGCEFCKNGDRKSSRFHLNFILKDKEGNFTAKIFGGGKGTYESLKETNEEYDLSKTVMKIKRNGTGRDTTYSILPSKEGQLTEDKLAQLHKVKLAELDPSKWKHEEESVSF